MTERSTIFLSYSHHDRSFVDRLRADLVGQGIAVWLDDHEIAIGESLAERIRVGIDTTDYFGVVISRHSVKSEWVRREVDIATNLEIEGRLRVLPLRIDDSELPAFLLGKRYADFRPGATYSDALASLLRRLTSDEIAASSSRTQSYRMPLPRPLESATLSARVVPSEGTLSAFGDQLSWGVSPQNRVSLVKTYLSWESHVSSLLNRVGTSKWPPSRVLGFCLARHRLKEIVDKRHGVFKWYLYEASTEAPHEEPIIVAHNNDDFFERTEIYRYRTAKGYSIQMTPDGFELAPGGESAPGDVRRLIDAVERLTQNSEGATLCIDGQMPETQYVLWSVRYQRHLSVIDAHYHPLSEHKSARWSSMNRDPDST